MADGYHHPGLPPVTNVPIPDKKAILSSWTPEQVDTQGAIAVVISSLYKGYVIPIFWDTPCCILRTLVAGVSVFIVNLQKSHKNSLSAFPDINSKQPMTQF
ncbi:hypothetical protein IQ243_11235 [Nostocales cyanobacterium LEGE 11386]|nr:hypothetical protein [Nostocales cyanobacterium LEGE 11386]